MEIKKKIRVVHVVQSPGGVERYLQSLLKYLNHEVYENILICSFDYNKKDYIELVDDFVNIEMIREIKVIKDLQAIISVRKLLKKYRPDLVYFHSSKAGAIGRIANIGLRNRCLYNPHGWAFNIKGNLIKQCIYTNIERILSHLCTTIVCISDAEKKSAQLKRICSEKKLRVIYNGIDFDEYKDDCTGITRKQIGIPEKAFVIGMVGRISTQKAPDIFVKAAKIIKSKIPNSFFLLVGDGEDRSGIEQLILENGLSDSFCITGWVKNSISYIQLFNIATLLSRWEGFGLVLPEYMMANKPIVATRVDAIPYIIIDRENGILVDQDDYKSVAEIVCELYLDADASQTLAQRGREIAKEKFNVVRVARKYECLFREIVSL